MLMRYHVKIININGRTIKKTVHVNGGAYNTASRESLTVSTCKGSHKTD